MKMVPSSLLPSLSSIACCDRLWCTVADLISSSATARLQLLKASMFDPQVKSRPAKYNWLTVSIVFNSQYNIYVACCKFGNLVRHCPVLQYVYRHLNWQPTVRGHSMVASRREDFVDMFELIVRLGCDCDWNAYLCKPICLIVIVIFWSLCLHRQW